MQNVKKSFKLKLLKIPYDIRQQNKTKLMAKSNLRISSNTNGTEETFLVETALSMKVFYFVRISLDLHIYPKSLILFNFIIFFS